MVLDNVPLKPNVFSLEEDRYRQQGPIEVFIFMITWHFVFTVELVHVIVPFNVSLCFQLTRGNYSVNQSSTGWFQAHLLCLFV